MRKFLFDATHYIYNKYMIQCKKICLEPRTLKLHTKIRKKVKYGKNEDVIHRQRAQYFACRCGLVV